MKHQDYINDFFIFLLKTNPNTVNRILNDLKLEGKCAKAPDIALKIVKEMRKKDIIKKLAKVKKCDLFTVLLTASNPPLLKLITELVKELAAAKVNKCTVPQHGGAKKSPKKKSVKKRKSVKRKSVKNPRVSVKKRKSPCFKDKVAKVMGEFKRGKLKTSSGMKVKNRSQAIAIALSVGDKVC